MYSEDIKEDNLWLMKGDCLERMKEIPDGSVDLILTDPPYGITACKWDSVIPLEPMWIELKRIIKPNGAIVMFGSQPFTSVLVTSNLKMFKYTNIKKNGKQVIDLPFSSTLRESLVYEKIVVLCCGQPRTVSLSLWVVGAEEIKNSEYVTWAYDKEDLLLLDNNSYKNSKSLS